MTGTVPVEIKSDRVPKPGGHYAQAVSFGNMLFVSGQLGVLPHTPSPEQVPVKEQVRHALEAIERIISEVSADRTRVLKCTVYVTDIADWDEANGAYSEFFGNHRPARAVVPCANLHFGAKVEIDAIVGL